MFDPYCNDCRDLQGFRRVRMPDGRGGSYSALAKCRHGESTGGGFTPVADVLQNSEFRIQNSELGNAALTRHDKKIAGIIQARVGRINAIRGRDLAVAVWPSEMADPAKYESAVRRWLEDSISRLRRFAHLPIAASKTAPMGYYIPSTAEECDEVHDRLFREGIERIKDSQLFRFDRDLVERLRGQLQLQEVGSGK